jgi:hypothetical protein
MIRYYVMPTVGGATGPQDLRMPKYGSDYPGLRIRYFGYEDLCFYSAEVTQEQHDALVANADVRGLPPNIDQTLGATVATNIETYLENHSMPGDWVRATMTYRQVMNNVLRLMKAMEFFELYLPQVKLLNGRALSTVYNTISQEHQDRLTDVATLVGVTITPTDTIRQVLKDIALAVTEEHLRADLVRL